MQSASDSTEEICNADSSTSGCCQKRTVVENMSTDSDEEKSSSISTSPLFKTPACNWRMKKKRRSLNTLFEEPAGTVACYLKYESPSRNVLDCIEINSLGPSKPSCEVPESLASLLDENNVSWTSSMASPLTADVTWSNLNTEEKKVLLPSHHDSKPRALFSPDGNENSCCKLLELTPVKEQSEQAGSTTPSNSQFLSSPISSYNSKQKRRRRKSKLTLFVKQESSACEKNYSSFSKCVLEEQAGLENDLQCENNSESGMTQHFLNDVSFTTLDEICQASEIMVTTTNSPMEISINVEDCNKAVQCDDQLISSDIQNITLGEKEKNRVLINRTSTPIVDRLNSVPQRKRIKFMSALAEDSVSDYQCWSNSNLLPDVKQKHLAEEWLQVDKSLMDMVTVNLMPTCSDTDHTAVIRSRVQSIRTSNENSFPYFPARNQPTVQSFSKQREIQITDVMKFALTLGAVEMRMDNSSIKPSITSQELVQFSKLETNSNVCNLSTRNNAKTCVEAKVNTKFHIKSSDNSLLGVGSDESTNNSKCSYKLQCNEKVEKSSECQSVTVYEVEPKCEDQFTYIAAGVIDECITFLQSDEKCKTSISQYSIPNTSLNKEEGNRVSLDSSSSKQDGVVDSTTFLKTDSCATAVVPLFEQNRCNEKQDDVQNGRTILKTRKQCCNSEKEVRRELVNCCNRSCDDITHPDLMTKTRVSEDKATYLHGVQAFQSTLSIAPNTKEKSKNDASIPLDIGNTNASVKENVAHPAANQETQKTLSVEPEYKDCADTGSCCNYQSLSDTQMVRAVDDIELMLEYTGEDGLAPASSISTSTVSMQRNSNRNFDRNDVSVKMVSEMSCKKNFTLSNKYSDNRSTECDLQENTSKTVPEKHAASMQSHLTQKSSNATIPQNTSVLQLKPNKIKQVNAPQSTGEECGTEENLHTAREMRQVYDKYMERLLVVSGNDVCVVKGNIETTKYETTPYKLSDTKGFPTAGDKALEDTTNKTQDIFEDDMLSINCLETEGFHTASDKIIHTLENVINETQGNFADATLPVNYLETRGFHVASDKTIHKTEDATLNTEEIFEDVTTLFKLPQVKGFATSSGKALHISEDALKKTQGVFADDTTSTKSPQVKGFATASGKAIHISEDALKKAKGVFEDDPTPANFLHPKATTSGKMLHISEEVQEVFSDDLTPAKFPHAKGFSAGYRKAIDVSEHSLKKVRGIFEGDTTPAKLPQAKGFATASGKALHISKDALKKAQGVFADDPTPTKCLHPKATDCGKTLHISEDAVEKVQGVFVDDSTRAKFPQVKDFSAGCGKTIHISEDFLNETQGVLDDTLPVNYLETKDFPVASCKIINKTEDAIHNIQEIIEDVTTLAIFPQTKGFATASGKAVHISEDSLKKVRGIFEGDTPAKFHQAKSFSTGIEKTLNISEDALKESQEVLVDDTTSIKFPQDKGFVTASGKAVHISEDSLKKVQRIFEGDTMPAKLPQANGFATASGKTIHISEEALKKAQEVFADNPTPVLHTKAPVSVEALHISEDAVEKPQGVFVDDTIQVKFPPVKGFTAGWGKTIHTSEDFSNETQWVFADDTLPVNYLETKDFPVASDKTINKTEDVIHNIQEIFEDVTTLAKFPQTKGFATASGKAVHVSEDSLKKVRGIFEGDTPAKFPQAKRFSEGIEKALNISEDALKEAQEVLADDTTSIKFPQAKGFVTASGKAVHISEDSLKRVRGIFEGDTTPAKLPQANGFAVASGSALHISEYALKKAQVVFADDTASTKFPQVNGFATAGGKAIHISEDALKKAQVVFADAPVKFLHPKAAASGETVLISEDALHKIQGVFVDDITSDKFPKVKGFATGSGEAIHVSEDDLKKAERIFADNPLSTNFPQVKGFVTASGELVHISKDSLKKVRGIFDGDKLSQVRSISSASGRTKQISEDKIQIGFAGDTVPFNHSETKYFASSLTNAVHISENAVKKEQETMETKSSDLRPALVDVYTECEKTGIVSNRKLMTDQGYDLSYGKTTSPVKLKYFSTASSKADHLTEVSPKKFQDKEPCGKMKHIYPKPMGFSTGTGKVVSVSEDCLKKARELFSDDNDTTLNRTVTSAKSDVSSKESLSNFVSGRYQAKKKRKTADVQKECEIISKQEVQGDQTVLSVSSNTCHSKVKPQFGNLNISSRDCFTNDNSSKDAVEDSVRSRSVSGYSEKLHSDRLRSLKEVQGESDDCVSHAIGAGSCSQSLLLQEVLECTSALFADEDQLDLPSWATSYVTCPDMVHDRIDAPVPMLSSNSTEPYPRPGSPVLGRPVCFRKVRKKRKSNSSSVSTTPSPAVTTSTFKVPYKKSDTTTPTTVPTHKRVAECIPAGAPFAKKPRTGVSCKLRPEIASRKIHNDGASSVGPRAVSDAVASARRLAAVQQQESIKQGPIQRPCIGSLLMMKQLRRDEQRTWVQVAVHRVPGQYTQTQILKYGVKENITNITAENATEFKFSAWNFYSPVLCAENIDGLPVGDGARLIMDSNGCAGLEQVTRAFLACSGVEPTLVPVDWVRNHYRWLVWKLAATERSFPDLFAGRCLTPNTVLLQLKYRYDREIDCNQRPAVRRIMEKDDASGKRLVLCVAKVFKRTPNDNNATKKGSNKLSSTAGYELELTDGWYSVLTTVDREMFSLIDRGMVAVGTKLVTHGAELLNCDQGCSPLEAPADVRLKLHTNSTRRARWDTKLGYHSNPGPLQVSMSSILPYGGLISCVTVVVARVYPVLFVQKVEGGRSVIRTERTEAREAALFERRHQERAECMYSQERAEFQEGNRKCNRDMRGLSTADLAGVTSGQELCEMLNSAPDPTSLQAQFSEQQHAAVTEYRQGYQDKLLRELETRVRQRLGEENMDSRTVTTLLKVHCLDANNAASRPALLSVWRASEEVLGLFREGVVLRLYSVTANGMRYGDLQLSAGRQTRYKSISPTSHCFPRREVTCLSRLTTGNFYPAFGELDVVGVVIYIGGGLQQSTTQQTLYLANADMSLFGITFWGGIKEFGWEEVLKPTAVIAASNLQWHHTPSNHNIPYAYASEVTTFSQNPRQPHLQEAMILLKQDINTDINKFVSLCKEIVLSLLTKCNYNSPQSLQDTEFDGNHRSFATGAAAVQGIHPMKCNADERTCTTESGSDQKTHLIELSDPEQENTPSKYVKVHGDSTVTESPAVQRRLSKLQLFGDPPPLSPLFFSYPPSALKKSFQVPVKNPPDPVVPDFTESPPLNLD